MENELNGRKLDKAVAVAFGHNVKETEQGYFRLYDAAGWEEVDDFPSETEEAAWNTCDRWSADYRVGYMLRMIQKMGWWYRLSLSRSDRSYIVCEVYYNDHECTRAEGRISEGTAICRAFLEALEESGTSAVPVILADL